MVRQVDVPPEARALSTLPEVDYADAFVVEPGLARGSTPEQWLRTMLEGAPLTMRKALRWTWLALGLRLGPEDADGLVFGWEVRRSTRDHALIGAGSRIGMPAELLLRRRGDSLTFDTLVRHENAVARAVWAATEPGHVPVARRVLEEACRRNRAEG
jgi:hypothetical protein